MVLPGHLAGGYLAATALLAVFHPDLSTSQINSLLIIGTLAGELPDIDLIFFNLKHRQDRSSKQNSNEFVSVENTEDSESHRNYITHVPFFWLVISALIILAGSIFDSIITEYFGWMILLGTISHFILDSIEYGIRWLAPISKKRYALKYNVPMEKVTDRPGSILQYFHFIIRTYWKTKTIWCEILISIIALVVLFKSF